ncbi:hypothetical protein A8C32_08110 [Flavivirga aquatica]|uniref:Uncharacterized protein n=1 Tax=Flavivirga aquatica TaxID=1849968 RepID=A0A1E5SJ22_9FLAO|nr:hypothetical protein [Flavivirga aquatica]OEJ99129.1 hypothetical protein A8C32_08110 [Flavivirga aquatica]
MKYYSIGISDDPKVIGYYPQLKFKKDYNPSLSDGYYNVSNNKFPDFVPNYELELHSKANLVNLLPLYPEGKGLLVDEKVRQILKKHCLPSHAFYPMKLHHKGNILDYYWFHYIPNDFWNLIDSDNSYAEVVKIEKGQVSVIKKIKIRSLDQINQEKNIYTGRTPIRLGQLKMFTEFCQYDFYKTGAFNHIIISEKLKNALEHNDVTGYKVKLFEKITINKLDSK